MFNSQNPSMKNSGITKICPMASLAAIHFSRLLSVVYSHIKCMILRTAAFPPQTQQQQQAMPRIVEREKTVSWRAMVITRAVLLNQESGPPGR